MSNPFVTYSEPVRAVLGPAAVTSLGHSARDYTCIVCRQGGDARREATSVVVERPRAGAPLVSLAHAGCMDSTVIDSNRDTADPALWSDTSESLRSIQMLLPTADGPQAAGLVIDRPTGLTAMVADSGDTHDMLVGLLLSLGWELLTDMSQRLPVLTRQTVIELDDRGQGRIVLAGPQISPDSAVLLDQLPDSNPQWTASALHYGAVRLLAGAITASERDPLDHAAIAAAIARGAVAAADVAVRRLG